LSSERRGGELPRSAPLGQRRATCEDAAGAFLAEGRPVARAQTSAASDRAVSRSSGLLQQGCDRLDSRTETHPHLLSLGGAAAGVTSEMIIATAGLTLATTSAKGILSSLLGRLSGYGHPDHPFQNLRPATAGHQRLPHLSAPRFLSSSRKGLAPFFRAVPSPVFGRLVPISR